jgi:hypothetical protein
MIALCRRFATWAHVSIRLTRRLSPLIPAKAGIQRPGSPLSRGRAEQSSDSTWAKSALALALLLPLAPAVAQAPSVVHGADSLFTAPGVKLAWVVRRGPTEEGTEVVIRTVNTGGYAWVRVDGVDPFSKQRKVLVTARPLGRQTDLVVPRAAFADHPSAEIHLFGSADDLVAERPTLTVFYLGVPDTTPEFAAPHEAEAYLERMLGETK